MVGVDEWTLLGPNFRGKLLLVLRDCTYFLEKKRMAGQEVFIRHALRCWNTPSNKYSPRFHISTRESKPKPSLTTGTDFASPAVPTQKSLFPSGWTEFCKCKQQKKPTVKYHGISMTNRIIYKTSIFFLAKFWVPSTGNCSVKVVKTESAKVLNIFQSAWVILDMIEIYCNIQNMKPTYELNYVMNLQNRKTSHGNQ